MFNPKAYLQLNPAQNMSHHLATGRLLYYCQDQQPAYWLKLQVKGVDVKSETSFEHELGVYQKLQLLHQQKLLMKPSAASVCLTHQLIPSTHILGGPEHLVSHALMLADSQALFVPTELNFATQLHLLIQSLNVLGQLHDEGYVHGDLKTQHFRRQQQQCYLIDFEQCVEIGAQVENTVTATPRYMAPELFHAKNKTIQTDIYALGAIWLQWLNHVRWPSRSYIDWAYWHCQFLSVELDRDFAMLQPILMRMLAKNQSQRYQHIDEIRLDLARVV